MKNSSYREKYLKEIETQYAKKFSKSKKMFDDGIFLYPNFAPHTARLFKPFPPYIQSAKGSNITTIDDINLLDFWQGHFSNILGHNHPILINAVKDSLDKNIGLQLGLFTHLENKLASILRKITGLEQYIFTTSGTLSTMYAIMLGLAHTKKSVILKLEGGWHGSHPWSLVGVRYPNGLDEKIVESAGLPRSWAQKIITVPINDIDALKKCFKKYGSKIGVFILELVLGNSGMIMASREFIYEVRKLTEKHNVALVIDEMVTGFRVHSGGLYKLYGIEPDIVTFGKIVAGGMPFACIAGKKDILIEASISKKMRVLADSGTFSCHPVALKTAITIIEYLLEHNNEIYPAIINNMNILRNRCQKIMDDNNIAVDITGKSNDNSLPNFPIATIRFIKDELRYDKSRAISHWNNQVLDLDMRDRISRIALMLNDIYVWQGLGVMTYSHTLSDIDKLIVAYQNVAQDLKRII